MESDHVGDTAPSTEASISTHSPPLSASASASTPSRSAAHGPATSSTTTVKTDASVTFESIKGLSSTTRTAIQLGFNFEHCTPVQGQVLKRLPFKEDLLVRARTGSGKTLAYLAAAIDTAATHEASSDQKPGMLGQDTDTRVVILVPTRELAQQVAEEAAKLAFFHRWSVRACIGGTRRERLMHDMLNKPMEVLVATPGRLLDVLQNNMQVRSRLSQVKALVYDEADTLLDLGFGKDISQIRRLLTSNLQTFLFSATVPERLLRIAGEWMRPGYITVDTLNKEDAVHFNVIRQSYVKVPFMQQKQVLYHILDRHLHANPQGKVMIFCPTVRLTMWVAETINAVRGREVMVLHSKMSQPERTRIVRRFKAARSVIMATTDVSARGVDYDGIDLVIQLGVPRNIDSYTHRIGRTGRAGKTGEAILVLSPYEMPFLRHLHGTPILPDERFASLTAIARDPGIAAALRRNAAADRIAHEAYISQLSYYIGLATELQLTRQTAVAAAQDFAMAFLDMPRPPPITSRLAQVLGITRVRGVELSDSVAAETVAATATAATTARSAAASATAKRGQQAPAKAAAVAAAASLSRRSGPTADSKNRGGVRPASSGPRNKPRKSNR